MQHFTPLRVYRYARLKTNMKRWILGFVVFPIAVFISLLAFHLITSQEQNIEIFGVREPTLEKALAHKDLVGDYLAGANHAPEPKMFSESFTDDSHIGRRKRNKVEIRCFERGKGTTAEIKFYSRFTGGGWTQRQSFALDGYSSLGCDPKIQDFNNDGLKDLTYRSNVAARGANDVRTLFIYDRSKDELVHIKNSEDYPNLAYNKTLNCLDSLMFHGATTTVFLKLEGDTLREFASVGTGLERVVSVTDKNGKSRVLSRKKMRADDVYTRFSSFDPPR